jgi:hypothetical protein
MKIFNITHKAVPLLNNQLYQPFQVNSAKNPIIFEGILQDNSLDNISSENDNFCELTACYWLWKNLKNEDFIGLCHYRRYFNFFPNKLSLKPSSQKRISQINFEKHKLATTSLENHKEIIATDLKSFDMILPRARKMKMTISEDYIHFHRESDWLKTKEIILQKYPEFEKSFETYLDKNKLFYECNMMITSKKIWDEYHAWLFDILFELKKNIDIPEDNYQKRIFGFLSERLLNLYVLHHKYKIKEYPMLFVNE